jgi:hypothetical protein
MYACFYCEKRFVTKIGSAEHMAKEHDFIINNLDKMCFVCKVEVEDTKDHLRLHNCPYPCGHCKMRFLNQEKLDRHIENFHGDTERPFSCDLCRTSFKTLNNLRSHQTLVHTAEEDKKFVCEVCNKRYAQQALLNAHFNAIHSDVKRFPCNFCGERFKILHSMKRHCLQYHGEENPYPCPACPEKLKTLNDLKKHQESNHGVSMNVQKFHDVLENDNPRTNNI